MDEKINGDRHAVIDEYDDWLIDRYDDEYSDEYTIRKMGIQFVKVLSIIFLFINH